MSVTADKNQRMHHVALPFVFVLFIISFPAGLLVYWITTNLWTVGQQYRPPHARATADRRRPPRSSGRLRRRRRSPRRRPRAAARCGGAPTAGEAAARRRSAERRRRRARGGRRRRPRRARRRSDRDGADDEPAIAGAATASARSRRSRRLGLDARGRASTEDGETITATVEGEDLGLFIGRHGQTIDAIQHSPTRRARETAPSRRRVVVDAEGYRARRQQALERQADDAADEALRFDRAGRARRDERRASARIVHEYLRDRDDVETHSEGEEPDRHLVVAPLLTFHV